MKYLLLLTLLCSVGVPDDYPPKNADGANGAKEYRC